MLVVDAVELVLLELVVVVEVVLDEVVELVVVEELVVVLDVVVPAVSKYIRSILTEWPPIPVFD